MSKRSMEQLKDMLCREVDEIAEKGELSAGDLDTVHKLTDTIKNIHKIDALEEGTYSQYDGNHYMRDGGWEARGSYDRGNSYKRDSRGRYSRGNDMEYMREQLREMMDGEGLSGSQREAIRKAMEAMK